MTFSGLTTRTSGNARQFSNRGRGVDMFIVHHAATTSESAVLSMMSTGSRQVSANYVVNGKSIIGVVPEEFRAWTSGSAQFDGRAITVETVNDRVGQTDMTWTISEDSYQSLAKLIADSSTRYGFPLDRDHVVGHRELYSRWGAGYSTACPSGINLDRLVEMAKEYQKGGTPGSDSSDLSTAQKRILILEEQVPILVQRNEDGAIFAFSGGASHIPTSVEVTAIQSMNHQLGLPVNPIKLGSGEISLISERTRSANGSYIVRDTIVNLLKKIGEKLGLKL